MKVPNPHGSGKDIAKAKGVRRETGSEGRRRQSSGPTNRNLVRPQMRVRLQRKLKPDSYTESSAVNKAGRWSERMCEYPGRSYRRIQVDVIGKKSVVTTNCKKSAEVIVPGEKNPGKDRTIVSPQ